MKQRFFIILAVLALTVVTGCGDKPQAPDYDGRSTDFLVDACQAIRQGETASAMGILQKMLEMYPDNKFASVAYRQEQKRELIEKANELLKSTSLNQLISLIRETEGKGMISPELLAYSRICTALDQLRLFVSRMPWTSAEALTLNLDSLEPYLPVLSASPAFMAFWNEQHEVLKKLKVDEARQALAGTVRMMERSLITGTGQAQVRSACERLDAARPRNALQQALTMADKATAEAQCRLATTAERRAVLEVAALNRWKALPEAARQVILAHIRTHGPASVSGYWLAVQNKLAPSALMAFFQALTREYPGVVPNAEIAREIMENHLLSREQYRAWCWKSPCPGPAEIVTRLRQVGIHHPANKK